MKITVSRLFDTSLISKSQSFKDLGPYFDYQLQLNDNFYRTITNGVNWGDNMAGSLIGASLTPGVTSTVNLGLTPVAVLIGQQDTTTHPITSFVWTQDSKLNLLCTITVADSTYKSPIKVTLVVLNS